MSIHGTHTPFSCRHDGDGDIDVMVVARKMEESKKTLNPMERAGCECEGEC